MAVLTKVRKDIASHVSRIGECDGVEYEDAFSVISPGGQHRRKQSEQSSVSDMVWIAWVRRGLGSQGWALREVRRHFSRSLS